MKRTMIFPIQYRDNRRVSRAAANINERHVGDRTFTFAERTEAKHDMNFILQQVKGVMSGAPFCANALSRYDDDDLFTTAAVSEIVSGVVAESHYYNQFSY